MRSSIYVAPLNIVKSSVEKPPVPSVTIASDVTADHQAAFQLEWPDSELASPLLTHETGVEEVVVAERAPFHSYIRAFFPFEPVNSLSPSTVTLPLRAGDVILVHSIAHSGWADGTKLDDGSRG